MMFVGFFALCSGVIIAVLVSSNEQRVRQQIIASVEQEGMQLTRILTRRIRSAERVLAPAIGATGSILTLQMADEAQNPTIIALQSGALIVIEHDTRRVMSSDRITISNLSSANTSATASRPSVSLSFVVSRQVPLAGALPYIRPFEVLISLFPDDVPTGDDCGCTAPVCVANHYSWQVCDNQVCSDALTDLPCS
jgi:hypothetical protein